MLMIDVYLDQVMITKYYLIISQCYRRNSSLFIRFYQRKCTE